MSENDTKVLEAVKVPAGPVRTSGEDLSALFAALCEAQKSLHNVQRDAENPHFRSKYATLSAVVDTIRKPLADNGLVVMQWPTNTPHGVGVITRIAHTSGQWMEHTFSVVPRDYSAQPSGGALTYCCRYSLCSIFLCAPEDLDGEDSMSEGNDAARKLTAKAPPEFFDIQRGEQQRSENAQDVGNEDPENPFSAERYYSDDEKVMEFAFRKGDPKVPIFLCTPEQLRGKKKYATEKKWDSWVKAVDREIGRRQAYAKHEEEVQRGTP